jgi:hypothetical protein
MTDGEYLLFLVNNLITARRVLLAEVRWRRRRALFRQWLSAPEAVA